MDGKQKCPPFPIVAGSLDLLELLAEKVPLTVPDDTAPDYSLFLPTIGKEGQDLNERCVQSEIHSRLVHGGTFGGGQLRLRWGRSAKVGLKGVDGLRILFGVAVVVPGDSDNLSRVVRVRAVELGLIHRGLRLDLPEHQIVDHISQVEKKRGVIRRVGSVEIH
jgi:hypothetical protein